MMFRAFLPQAAVTTSLDPLSPPAPPDGPRSKGVPVTITCAGNMFGRTRTANTEVSRRRGPDLSLTLNVNNEQVLEGKHFFSEKVA